MILRRTFLLFPDAADGGVPSPAPAAASETKPAGAGTSADIVTKGKKGKKEVDMEVRVSELEDELGGLKARNLELETLFNGARTAPSPANPKKSLLDELNDFLGL